MHDRHFSQLLMQVMVLTEDKAIDKSLSERERLGCSAANKGVSWDTFELWSLTKRDKRIEETAFIYRNPGSG